MRPKGVFSFMRTLVSPSPFSASATIRASIFSSKAPATAAELLEEALAAAAPTDWATAMSEHAAVTFDDPFGERGVARTISGPCDAAKPHDSGVSCGCNSRSPHQKAACSNGMLYCLHQATINFSKGILNFIFTFVSFSPSLPAAMTMTHTLSAACGTPAATALPAPRTASLAPTSGSWVSQSTGADSRRTSAEGEPADGNAAFGLAVGRGEICPWRGIARTTMGTASG
mmetsp:Transcript_44681/g.130067  ORF Transcript_44681/g.130067 Transcript_44681/m.130067 type:complete len:229 (-) Transcript_44681:2212-2898(-)